MISVRYLETAAAVAALSLVVVSGASAQSRCGSTATVQSGDTLYSISQDCRVALSRIYNLNPQLDPRSLSVGTEVRLTGGQAASDADNREESRRRLDADGRYRIEEGDTASSIAQAMGISLMELLNSNKDLDPLRLAVGEMINVPVDGRRSAALRVRPLSGSPGSQITVRARHLRPADYVTIGVGPRSSEWRALRDVQVAADGEISTQVRVPEWADPGDVLTFIVDTDRGVTLKSADFDVTARQDTGRDAHVELEGRVGKGVECATLTTPDGDLWSLTGDMNFTPGEYAKIEGTRADMSFCMQGVGTVEVTSYEEVPSKNR
ncbi:LysM peptidoglycan-binding domain-containing protein [Pseudohoeflea coraliihabitans]|uniref:LysM peptidoglycan-binding domain-containing protein n=1 Tax=Pseudohoeflea coraliihabitans TaxID=2860393 RepID=A0ABS6WPR4_9HYPH|nr:LysM peptidoglycan-binding domain-containing protein [Pseudohoeflea sp. DP4N28-3]MBW3097943.1 LysM peptidoglycan-binding domain-containing protein [Pseudohoeflea sp. DP4N28-3]